MSSKIFQLSEPIPMKEFGFNKKIFRVFLDDASNDKVEVWVDDGTGFDSFASEFPIGTVFIVCERPA